MTTNARKAVESARWILIGSFIWVGLGSILFPGWWYEFLFRGGWRTDQIQGGFAYLLYWAQRVLLYQIVEDPISLLISAAVLVGLKIVLDRGLISRPQLGTPTWKRQIAATVVLAVGLMTAWTVGRHEIAASLLGTERTEFERSSTDRFSLDEVRDYAYIDSPRVEALWGQVLPTMQLSEIQAERSISGAAEGQIGVENVASAKAGLTTGQKATERYLLTAPTTPRQVGLLLKHFNERKELGDYESLEVDSEQIKALTTLAELLKQYQISHDSRRLAAVTLQTLQKSVDEQQSHFASLKTPIVVRGRFHAIAAAGAVELSHLFFVRENMIAIRFVLETFPKDGPNVLSNSFRQLGTTESEFNLAAFGRVVSIQRGDNELRILISPYAVWHL